MKRSFRDHDLASLTPPLFSAASDSAPTTAATTRPLRRNATNGWDEALLSAYMVDADPPQSSSAGLGMGFELPLRGDAPSYGGSWSSHRAQMAFLYGETEEAPLKRRKTRRKQEEESSEPTASSDDNEVVPAARQFAKRTQLRRGFFASALKQKLEALLAENAALKELAKEVLDKEAKTALFAGLGSETSSKTPEEDMDAAMEPTVRRRDLSLVKVVQNAQKAFVVSNPSLPDNPIVWCSDAFLKMTGYANRSDVVGRNCRFLQGPKTDPRAVAKIRDAIHNKREVSVVLLNYKADGSTFWNRFFIAPLCDAQNAVSYYVGVQSDVTQEIEERQEEQEERQTDPTEEEETTEERQAAS